MTSELLKPSLVILLTLLALALAGKTVYTFWLLLKKAKPGFPVPSLRAASGDLLVMVLGQKKVLRWPYAGIFHIMIFWGFIVLFTTIVEMYGEAFNDSFVFPWIGGTVAMAFCQDLFTVLVLLGIVMALVLRLVVRPKRFEGSDHVDALTILGCITGIMLTLLCMHAWRVEKGMTYAIEGFFVSKWLSHWMSMPVLHWIAEVSYWLHLGLILFFLNWIPRGKHFHLITIIPNILIRKRYVRGKLRKLDLADEKAVSFGANQWPDFMAKDMLDTLACMECGRCVAVCPANNTGKELDPKRLHTDIRYSTQKKAKAILAGKEGFPPVVGNLFSDDFFWQCTTCAACVEECPATNEHIDKIMEVRRFMVLTEGKMRPETKQALKSLETQSNPFSLSHADRFAWAKDLNLPDIEDNAKAQYLYWVGCFGCFDQRNQKVTRAVMKLLQKAGVQFGLLKREERCTGDPARRIGNEDLYQTMAARNVEVLNKYQDKTIITQCPHCFNTIKNEYPDFGGNYQVIHYSQFLSQLIQEGRIPLPKEVNKRLAYHDSCYLGRHNGIYEPPRQALHKIKGATLLELDKSHTKSFCCGGGGGRMFMEEKEGKRVSVERVEQAAVTKPDLLVSNCPFCLSMFEDGAKSAGITDKFQPKDLAEVLVEAIE